MVIGNYTLKTMLIVELQSADIKTKPLTTRASDGSTVVRHERKFTISYYPAGNPFDQENADTLTYQIPIPTDEIERTKQYQAATRIMQQVSEGARIRLPDPVGSNIQDYLTPKSRPYFEYINKLLIRILTAGNIKLNKSAAVFGGYVLNLVEHAFAYRADPHGATYTPPKDMDVWLCYDSSQGPTEFSKTKMQNLFERNIIPYLKESGHTTTWETLQKHRLNYGVHNLVVDGEYRFDFNGNVYGSSSFGDLGDFTVNTLFYDVHTGKMSMRIASEYTLRDIISDHIRNRKLVPMLRCDRLQRIIRTEVDYDWYFSKMQDRERKTLAKGYKYPVGLTSLPDTFTTSMMEHLAMLRLLALDE